MKKSKPSQPKRLKPLNRVSDETRQIDDKPKRGIKALKPKPVKPLKPVNTVVKLTESKAEKDKEELKELDEIDYHIIGSGSSGNCVRIENIMIDIGLPYKHIKEDLYDTDIILITHTHYDHIKDSVYRTIRKEFPNIKIAGNHEVAAKYDIDFICNEDTPFKMNEYTITPFRGKHNVLCYGYIWTVKGKDIIYCTDSSDFENSPQDKKYDYLFLESNHDHNKLMAISRQNQYKKYGYNAYQAGVRHCSTQKCLSFYYRHRKSKDSKLIELHKSDRFY